MQETKKRAETWNIHHSLFESFQMCPCLLECGFADTCDPIGSINQNKLSGS